MNNRLISSRKSSKSVYYTELSPIVLFVYKRLSTTRLTVDSLLSNSEAPYSDLIVFSDGPKNAADYRMVIDVRAYIKQINGFKSVTIVESPVNLGLADSFISGITSVLRSHDSAIFVEDDNIVSSCFLNFMNNGLALYKDNQSVSCVSAYSWPFLFPCRDPYFLEGAETWTCATWSRAWNEFESDGVKLLNSILERNLSTAVDSYGHGFINMLKDQIAGANDSWGVRWWISAFLNQRSCLYSCRPLVVIADPGCESTHNKSASPLFRRHSELSHVPITTFPKQVNTRLLPNLLYKLMILSFRAKRVISLVVDKALFFSISVK